MGKSRRDRSCHGWARSTPSGDSVWPRQVWTGSTGWCASPMAARSRETRLLIATGVRARKWPNPAEAALEGVYTLRTSADAARLQAALAARPRRVLIIGARFHRFGGGLGLPRPRAGGHRRRARPRPAVRSHWAGSSARSPPTCSARPGWTCAPGSRCCAGGRREWARAASAPVRRHRPRRRCGGDLAGRRSATSSGSTGPGWPPVSGVWLRRRVPGVRCERRGDQSHLRGRRHRPRPACAVRAISFWPWSTGTMPSPGAQVAAHNMVCDETDRWAHLMHPAVLVGRVRRQHQVGWRALEPVTSR